MKSINFVCCLLSVVSSLSAQNSFQPDLFKDLEYRNLGAFRTGAWIADIAVPEIPDAANKYTFYVGTYGREAQDRPQCSVRRSPPSRG
ncbi:MAG: hypothetical protein WC865_07490 [Bacteroidales bacterium]